MSIVRNLVLFVISNFALGACDDSAVRDDSAAEAVSLDDTASESGCDVWRGDGSTMAVDGEIRVDVPLVDVDLGELHGSHDGRNERISSCCSDAKNACRDICRPGTVALFQCTTSPGGNCDFICECYAY